MKILGHDIEAIIFDKDGTLIDMDSMWIPWAEDIYSFLKKKVSAASLNWKEFCLSLGIRENNPLVDPNGPLAIGSMSESEVIIALKLYEWGIPWDTAVIHAKESIQYANERQNQSPAMREVQGVTSILQQWRKENVPIGVLTADDTNKAQQHLGHLQLLEYFDFVVGSDLVKRGKPYPDMAYLARDQYNIPLSQAMIIGDTNADMQLGKRAGLKLSVGFTILPDYTEHLRDADVVITRYEELLEE